MKVGIKEFHCMISLDNISSVSFWFQFGSCCALSLKNWLLKQAKIKEFVIFGQFLHIQLTN